MRATISVGPPAATGTMRRTGLFGKSPFGVCARAAAKYRRPTKVFEDVVQKFDLKYILSLDDVVASRGGIPLIEDGKIIGAIGCSGGTGSQDEVICTAGAALVNK